MNCCEARPVAPFESCGECRTPTTKHYSHCLRCNAGLCSDHARDVGGSMQWGYFKCPTCALRENRAGFFFAAVLVASIIAVAWCAK